VRLEHRWNTSLEERGVPRSSGEREHAANESSSMQIDKSEKAGALTRNEGVPGSSPGVGSSRSPGNGLFRCRRRRGRQGVSRLCAKFTARKLLGAPSGSRVELGEHGSSAIFVKRGSAAGRRGKHERSQPKTTNHGAAASPQDQRRGLDRRRP